MTDFIRIVVGALASAAIVAAVLLAVISFLSRSSRRQGTTPHTANQEPESRARHETV